MVEQTLFDSLRYDLHIIGVPLDFTLILKPYSKKYYGRYDPNTRKLVLYLFEDEKCTTMRAYEEILKTAIHEATHHYQWFHSSKFKRIKGVMHNFQFIQIERLWRLKALDYRLIEKEAV
jgi:hypothetical protein